VQNRRRKTTQSDEETDKVAPSGSGGEEEDEMAGMVDLSTMLDDQAHSDEDSAEESDSEGGDDGPTPTGNRGESDEEQLVLSGEEDEGEQSAALDALGDFIGGLETVPGSKKRKADELELSAEETAPRKRRVLQERTEGATEGEFSSTTIGMQHY
jgi:hypothetical protein